MFDTLSTHASTEMPVNNRHINLPGVLRVIRKRWLMIVLIFFSTVAMATIFIAKKGPPLYNSTSLLLVKFGREFIYQPDADRRGIPIYGRREAVINAEVQILRSNNVIESVVRALGPMTLYPDLVTPPTPSQLMTTLRGLSNKLLNLLPAGVQPSKDAKVGQVYSNVFEKPLRAREIVADAEKELIPLQRPLEQSPRLVDAAVQRFERHFSAESVIQSDLIRVSFEHENPQMAARALNLALDVFKERHLQVFSDHQTTAFFEKKVATSRTMLMHAEENLETFLAKNPTFLHKERDEFLLNQRESLEASLNTARTEIVGLRQNLAHLNANKKAIAKNPNLFHLANERAAASAEAELVDLQLTERKLLGQFKETHPQVVSVRKQIELLKTFLRNPSTGSRVLDLELQIADTLGKLRSREAEASGLEQQLEGLKIELQEYPTKARQYRHLIQERDINEGNYRAHLKRLEEARISEEMDHQKIANISVIQEGLVPAKPVSAGKMNMMAIRILLGASVSLAAAFAVESFSRKLI